MKRFSQCVSVVSTLLLSMGLLAVFLSSTAAAQISDPETVDLSVTIVSPQHVAPGETYVANIAYSNLGDIASPDDTSVTLLLPEGVEFVSATDRLGNDYPPTSADDNPLIWQVGSVPASECCQHIFVTLSVADDRAEGEELVLKADILSEAVEADASNNTASTTSVVCDMAGSTKQVHAGEVKPGDILTYTIQLRLAQRAGNDPLQQRQVTLVDTLPAQNQVRFLGWSGPTTGTWDGNTIRWQGLVKAGEPVTLRYRMGVEGETPSGNIITNTAEISYGPIQLRLGPTASTVNLPPNAAMIGPFGHTWQVQEGLTVEVPSGAVQEMTRFEYQFFNGENPDEYPVGYMYAHRFFELSAYHFGEQYEFGETIRLTLKLKPEEIAGMKRETLRLWYRAGSGEPWAMLGEPNWLSEDTLAFTTDHFTQFALFGIGQNQIYIPLVVRY
jgi:hypothetical protein